MSRYINIQDDLFVLNEKTKIILKEKEDLLRRTQIAEDRWTETMKMVASKQQELAHTQLELMQSMNSKVFHIHIFLHIYTYVLISFVDKQCRKSQTFANLMNLIIDDMNEEPSDEIDESDEE